MEGLKISDFLTLASIVVAVAVGLVTWILSWVIFRLQVNNKELSYSMRMVQIISHEFSGPRGSLEIKYNGEIIDKLVLFEIDIKNTGNSPLENIRIHVSNQGGIYLIPGYFEDVPPGYHGKWDIEREDGEDSDIVLDHINPKQIVKARFVMDNLPSRFPEISCPMPGLTIKEAKFDQLKPLAKGLTRAILSAVFHIKI